MLCSRWLLSTCLILKVVESSSPLENGVYLHRDSTAMCVKCCHAFREGWGEAGSSLSSFPVRLPLCGNVMQNHILSLADTSTRVVLCFPLPHLKQGQLVGSCVPAKGQQPPQAEESVPVLQEKGVQRVWVCCSASGMRVPKDFILFISTQCLHEEVTQAVTSAVHVAAQVNTEPEIVEKAFRKLMWICILLQFKQREVFMVWRIICLFSLCLVCLCALSSVILEGGFMHFVYPFMLTAYYFPFLCVIF